MSRWLTDRRRENLERLAAYLEALPKSYRHFDMGTFMRHDGEHELDPKLDDQGVMVKDPQRFLSDCGTVACAVGHGPAAGIPLGRTFVDRHTTAWSGLKSTTIDWDGYSGRNFAPHFESAWQWMFGGDWGSIDNTAQGAAARIRYVLKHGDAPDDFITPRRRFRQLYADLRVTA